MVKFGGIGSVPKGKRGLRGRARRVRKDDFEDLDLALDEQDLTEEERLALEGRRRREGLRQRQDAERRIRLKPNATLHLLDFLMFLVLGTALLLLLGLALYVVLR